MEIRITLFINLVLYTFVISQSFFYLMGLSAATKNMQPATYIESRKLLDQQLTKSLSSVYYLALISSLALVTFCVINPSGLLFICSIVSLCALIGDVLLAVKGNVPLNRQINSWTQTDFPRDWSEYRSKWFRHYNKRQALNVIGFLSLLTGIIFGFQ